MTANVPRSAGAVETPAAAAAPGWLVGPPGVLFILATAGAILVALDANTRSSFRMLLVTVPIWLAIAAVWALRMFSVAASGGLRMPARHWARWLAIPIAMGLVFAITRTDAVFDARLELSRGAMDRMAAEVLAGGSTQRGWVGLYDAGTVELTANGVRFVVDDDGFGRWGFAYAPSGKPVLLQEDSPATFTAKGGGWWTWVDESSFD